MTVVCFFIPRLLHHDSDVKEVVSSQPSIAWYKSANQIRPRPHPSVFKQKRSCFDLKTMLFLKRCFLVWTEKTMLSESVDVIKIYPTGPQTTRRWVPKMAGRRYHVASISRQFRGPIYWNAHASSSFEHVHWLYKSVFETNAAFWCGRAKTISVDANPFENGAKQLRFRVDGASENRNSYIVRKLKNK